ncbi:MAG: class I SAM-dependent methyltransferase [Planctomycetota bacterium]|nr:MAG: class I SAM-dependent methyltransferase [Planctomycetota bacterium]
MHARISSDNPYGYDRWGFAWEYVPWGGAAHLDFGCHKGAFLSALKPKGIRRLVGVDVSEEAVHEGRRLFPDLEIIKIHEAGDLPFDDRTFDSVSMLDVLEHVYDQVEVLAELNRVLKDEGRLVITVPGQHLFSFLDMGNYKFRFPRLHRWYYCLRHSQEDYEYRYVSNPDGLIGDISAKKRWHEHFGREKLKRVLREAGFGVIDFDGTGFFARVIGSGSYLVGWIKPARNVLAWLGQLDSRLFESTNLFCVAEKGRF